MTPGGKPASTDSCARRMAVSTVCSAGCRYDRKLLIEHAVLGRCGCATSFDCRCTHLPAGFDPKHLGTTLHIARITTGRGQQGLQAGTVVQLGASGVWEAVQICWAPGSCTELISAKCCRPSWKGKCVTWLLHVGIKAAVRPPSSTATFVLVTATSTVRDTQCHCQTARLLAGPP